MNEREGIRLIQRFAYLFILSVGISGYLPKIKLFQFLCLEFGFIFLMLDLLNSLDKRNS